MIKITTLENHQFSDLIECFSEAFRNYFVKFSTTEDYLQEKWHIAGVNYKFSYGAWVNGKLSGFIVHAIRENDGQLTAYNAGTGVIPSCRGLGITKKIYKHALPILKANGIGQSVLEVIQQNKTALHIYENVGFKKQRDLYCFSGQFQASPGEKIPGNIEIRPIQADWSQLQKFWDFKPDWEATAASVTNAGDDLMLLGLFEQELLCGYTAFNPENGAIRQFAIDKEKRRQGLGRYLFSQLSEICPRQSINNIDSTATDTLAFLQAMGMNNHINQYEMKLTIA